MIKPKSRKHEDRIKALEASLNDWKVTAQILIGDIENHRRRIINLEARKWWQVWK